jgi:hypothetical protein
VPWLVDKGTNGTFQHIQQYRPGHEGKRQTKDFERQINDTYIQNAGYGEIDEW